MVDHTRDRRKAVLLLVALVAWCAFVHSTASADKGKRADLPAAAELLPFVAGPYLIQVGDVLEIVLPNTVELNQTRTVGPDGVVPLLLVGSVPAAGRTIEEFTSELTSRYTQHLIDPSITVSVRQFSGMLIYVGGEVERPGVAPYRGGLTALEAIMDAGGFRTTARRKEVLLIRKDAENKPVGALVDCRSILVEGRFDLDVELTPSDIVFVPRKRISNVNLFVEQYFRNNWPIPVGLGFQVQLNPVPIISGE